MQLLDLTLPTPAENLALDEALLDEAEAADRPVETLRFWESDRPLVVVGRGSRIDEEVHVEACRALGVPVVRRASGGAAVLAGPGCLMYALVLSYERRPELRTPSGAHRSVLGTMAAALDALTPGVRCRGISDLALGDRKVSGNSVRAKRSHLLYHGTLLYAMRLDLVPLCLAEPPRQPLYRQRRPHEAFVINLQATAGQLRRALASAWGAFEACADWPLARTTQLVAERYGRPEWGA